MTDEYMQTGISKNGLSQAEIEFLQFKAEQREYLDKKLHLQGKIESL
jgi:hypothetical protein